jgi:hypothetical protein
MTEVQCRTCGGEMVHKSRLLLFLVGLLLVALPAVTKVVPYLWAPAMIFALTGFYLMTWASLGRGYWCRSCKRFSPLPQAR